MLRSERGFTMVEALVAALIMVVGLFAMIAVFDHTRDQSATAERDLSAVGVASAELEKARALPYAQVGLTGTPPATGSTKVLSRVSGSSFRVRQDSNGDGIQDLESLILSGSVAPVTTGVDVGGETMDVYRFITWRDEECPPVSLNGSLAGVQGVDNTLNTRATGVANTLTSVLALKNSVVVGTLVTPLLNTLNANVLTNVLNPVNNSVRPALTNLETTLSQGVDLCDADLSGLQQVATKLAAITTAVTALNQAVSSLDGALGQILSLNLNPLTIVGALTTLLNNTVNNAVTTAHNAITNPSGLSADLTTAIDSLRTTVQGLGANTDHNTKRVTVAVVPSKRAGVGPFEPVWSSTVVTDPDASVG